MLAAQGSKACDDGRLPEMFRALRSAPGRHDKPFPLPSENNLTARLSDPYYWGEANVSRLSPVFYPKPRG